MPAEMSTEPIRLATGQLGDPCSALPLSDAAFVIAASGQ
jgi:hypothetical protein